MARLLFKRGLQANLPTLDPAEPAFTTDEHRLYVGSGDGNKEFLGVELTNPANDDFIQRKSGVFVNRTLQQVANDITPLLPSSQPLDADLTAIAGLSPANDDILQRKSGAWANRTLNEVALDFAKNRTTTIELFDDFVAPYMPSGSGYTLSSLNWYTPSTADWYTGGEPGHGVLGLPAVALANGSSRTFFLAGSQGTTIFSTGNTPGIKALPNTLIRTRVVRGILGTGGTQTDYFGLFQSTAIDTAYGIYFKVSDSGNLYSVTTSSGGTEEYDTGVAMGAGVFRTLEFRVNASADTVDFYIDGVLKTSHTTYIFNDTMRFGFGVKKTSAGGNCTSLYIDYFYCYAYGLNRV